MGKPLLEVVNLGVKYGTLQAVNDVSFTLETGRILGIVGESGLGKSTLPWALTRLLPEAAALNSGGVWFDGVESLGTHVHLLGTFFSRHIESFARPRCKQLQQQS